MIEIREFVKKFQAMDYAYYVKDGVVIVNTDLVKFDMPWQINNMLNNRGEGGQIIIKKNT